MVTGLASLNRKMTKTIPAAVREAARAALEQGAREIVAFAKALCPVDSGALRDSIDWTWGDAPEGATVLGSVRPMKQGDERITIFAGSKSVIHASFVEFGTRQMAAHPFFYPAYRTVRRRVKGRVTRNVNAALKRGSK